MAGTNGSFEDWKRNFLGVDENGNKINPATGAGNDFYLNYLNQKYGGLLPNGLAGGPAGTLSKNTSPFARGRSPFAFGQAANDGGEEALSFEEMRSAREEALAEVNGNTGMQSTNGSFARGGFNRLPAGEGTLSQEMAALGGRARAAGGTAADVQFADGNMYIPEEKSDFALSVGAGADGQMRQLAELKKKQLSGAVLSREEWETLKWLEGKYIPLQYRTPDAGSGSAVSQPGAGGANGNAGGMNANPNGSMNSNSNGGANSSETKETMPVFGGGILDAYGRVDEKGMAAFAQSLAAYYEAGSQAPFGAASMSKFDNQFPFLYTDESGGETADPYFAKPVGTLSPKEKRLLEGRQADGQLYGLFKQYESSDSLRVQAILADTLQKLNAGSLTEKEKAALYQKAQSTIEDQSRGQLIGNVVWFDNKAYPLYDPSLYEDRPSFGSAYDAKWLGDKQNWSFDLGGMLNTALDGDDNLSKGYTTGQAKMTMGMNAASMLLNNLNTNDLHVVLSETSDGRRRACVFLGSSDMREKMTALAGREQSLLYNATLESDSVAKSRVLDGVLASRAVKAIYEQVTGFSTDRRLDLKMYLDGRHSLIPYYAYVVGEKDGNLSLVTPMYAGDRFWIVDKWSGQLVYDLTPHVTPQSVVPNGLEGLKKQLSGATWVEQK